MELKVWCDGIQRVVCGVSAQTTCQDVVFALAHATAQTGRFILIERWRNSERLLAPSEHPLQVLAKWGEYANDVTLVMKRSEQHHKTNANTALNQTLSPQHSSAASPLPIGSPPAGGGSPSGLSSPQNRRDLINLINNNKSIYMSLNRKSAGLTQNSGSSLPSPTKPLTSTPINPNNSSNIVPNASPLKSNSCPNSSHNNTNSIAKPAIDSMANELTQLQMNNKNNNSVELTPTKTAPAGGQRPRHPPPYSEAIYQSTMISNSGQTNTISSHLVPTTDNTNTSNKRRSAEPSPQSQKQRTNGTNGGQKELILHRDAVRLVDMQKETMKGQEMEMSSLEQQIGSIEKRLVDNELLIKRYKDEMEACHQLWLDQEVLIDQLGDQSQLEQELDQLVATASACEDEMASLKKKLSQCETDIGDCRQKISKLMDELEENERVARDIVFDKEEKERELSEQLRTALRDKNCDLESQKNDLQILTNNIKQLDSLFIKKSEEIDRILADIKEENLQGLALQAATESPKYNAASSGQPFHQRSGSTRRMIGSPRELENAVATNKNPHGVWV